MALEGLVALTAPPILSKIGRALAIGNQRRSATHCDHSA
jgi:hypothetical protein